jgi:hypothetical protein
MGMVTMMNLKMTSGVSARVMPSSVWVSRRGKPSRTK